MQSEAWIDSVFVYMNDYAALTTSYFLVRSCSSYQIGKLGKAFPGKQGRPLANLHSCWHTEDSKG